MKLNYSFTRKTILTISDLHVPYEHQDAVKFLKALAEHYEPDIVISLGDMVDWHGISFHPKHPDLASAGQELELIRSKMRIIEKLFPEMIIIGSNHGDLPLRKIKDAGLPTKFLRSYNEIYGVGKKWQFVDDLTMVDRNEVIYYAHGLSKDASRVAAQRGVHHICGHYHTEFRVDYVSNPRNLLWGVNGGCLIDREALAFEYGKLTLDRPIIGTPVICQGFPILEPMVLREGGRWVGKLI